MHLNYDKQMFQIVQRFGMIFKSAWMQLLLRAEQAIINDRTLAEQRPDNRLEQNFLSLFAILLVAKENLTIDGYGWAGVHALCGAIAQFVT